MTYESTKKGFFCVRARVGSMVPQKRQDRGRSRRMKKARTCLVPCLRGRGVTCIFEKPLFHAPLLQLGRKPGKCVLYLHGKGKLEKPF